MVINEAEEMTGEEQHIFFVVEEGADQIFALRHLSKKAWKNGIQLYLWCKDKEETHDRTEQKGVWEIMEMYGVGILALGMVKCFFFFFMRGVKLGVTGQ